MKLLALEAVQNASYYHSRYQQIERYGAELHVLNGLGEAGYWPAGRYRVAGSKHIDNIVAAARRWHATEHFDGVLTFSESGRADHRRRRGGARAARHHPRGRPHQPQQAADAPRARAGRSPAAELSAGDPGRGRAAGGGRVRLPGDPQAHPGRGQQLRLPGGHPGRAPDAVHPGGGRDEPHVVVHDGTRRARPRPARPAHRVLPGRTRDPDGGAGLGRRGLPGLDRRTGSPPKATPSTTTCITLLPPWPRTRSRPSTGSSPSPPGRRASTAASCTRRSASTRGNRTCWRSPSAPAAAGSTTSPGSAPGTARSGPRWRWRAAADPR